MQNNKIRLLVQSDMPNLMRLSQAAGWNQTEEDWIRLLELESEGCFGLESDNKIVATATAICYGTELSWIGMVLTDPDYRRRGFARDVTERAIEYAEQKGVRWIKLDATEMGRPLYRKLAFEDEAPIERWKTVVSKEYSKTGEGDTRIGSFRLDSELDRAAFGVDRSRLLLRLLVDGAISIQGQGYAGARKGANAAMFGPCVARSREAARKLLQWFLRRHAGQAVFWDILPQNREAVSLAREYGFSRVRELVRMVRPGVNSGKPIPHDDNLVYAAAGFEYG